jgi:predicted porin
LQRNFNETFASENRGLANCAQLLAVRGAFAGDGGLCSNKQENAFMQKKLLAIAVAGALAPAAAMAQSTVEIYGRANMGIDQYESKGSPGGATDLKGRLRVFDFGSRLGFRVNESLGGGMRAFVVIETGVNIDSGSNNGQSGSANASSGFWASRDSYAGIGGGWGDIRFGRQSPFYGNGIIMQGGSNYINQAMDSAFSFAGALAQPSGRESNVASYNSPTFGGFNVSLSWGPGASEGNAYTGLGGQGKEQLFAATARYTGGPIRAQVDYGTRKDVGNIENQDRNAWKVGAGWAYAPNSQISAIFGNVENKNLAAAVTFGGLVFAGAGSSPNTDIWILNWEHMFGQLQVIAQYAKFGKIKDLTTDPGNTDAQGYTLAAKYFLSKRTGVYASYNQIENKDNAWWDISNGGSSSRSTTAVTNRGADPRIVAVGVMHNF